MSTVLISSNVSDCLFLILLSRSSEHSARVGYDILGAGLPLAGPMGWRYYMWAHRLVFGRPSRAVLPFELHDEWHTTSAITWMPALRSLILR